MGWWVAEAIQVSWVYFIAWVVWVIGSICLHELAHGWAAIRVGDRTPIEKGHMTWNPLVHMGQWSLLAFAVIGIAWGLMPVNPARMRGRHADALVAAAGPAMNLGLAIAAALAGGIWLAYFQWAPDNLWTNMQTFWRTGVMLNLVLLVFNLLPIPPLDGSRILASFSSAYRQLLNRPQSAGVMLGIFLLVLIFAADVIWRPALEISAWSVEAVHAILPGARPIFRP